MRCSLDFPIVDQTHKAARKKTPSNRRDTDFFARSPHLPSSVLKRVVSSSRFLTRIAFTSAQRLWARFALHNQALLCTTLLCFSWPCFAVSCLALPCLALNESYLICHCFALPCLALSCLAWSSLVLPCLPLPCFALPDLLCLGCSS